MMGAVATASANDPSTEVPEEELFRAQLYRLMARLLAAPPHADLLAALQGLGSDSSELGEAFAELGRAARTTTPARVAEEYQDLFIGLGRGELLPYGSFYRTGFLQEKPLAELRADLARLGIARVAEVKEPEDHIAALCEVIAGLIDGGFGGRQTLTVQRGFFDKHLAPWAGRFFGDLETAATADFYRRVGRVGTLFMGVETTAFAMI
jgi:TorA maturation chaperone TorD